MRILLIEDDKDIISALKPSLEAENFVVDAVMDGEAGSFAARTNDYDLVIVDNILPKKLGPQICTEIREDGKNMPILMLSVKSEIETKAQALNLGADDYLTKPYSFVELLARVRALLRRPLRIESAVLVVDELMLDRDGQVATCKGRELSLTQKEFALLELLMGNPGRVVSKGIIIEHIWDMNANLLSNAIETHVRNLRVKIEDITGKRVIHTITGRGYKLGIKQLG